MSLTVEDLLELGEEEYAELIGSLDDREARALLYDWKFWARPEQIPPPGEWTIWLILAGRGWGKTRTGAETVREWEEKGEARRIAFIAETPADARDVMIEGATGIMNVYPPEDPNRPHYEPSKRRITWPGGAWATVYSSHEPDKLRGPAHDAFWGDEPAKWANAVETWDNLMLGFREGDPRGVLTGTPRPTQLIRDLLADPDVITTRGTTYDNIRNLAPKFRRYILRKYEGTRLGRQELHAEVLDDVEGALWTLAMIEAARRKPNEHPEFKRIVVAVDPAVTSNDDSDETGLTVEGLGVNDHGYVIADESMRGTPGEWAERAVELYHEYEADRIVGEVNNGGDLVELAIRSVDRNVSYKAVRASRGKAKRAEPVASLFEQGRCHLLGSFPALEDQMRTYVPDDPRGSPDRMDSMVWGITELMLGEYKPRPKAKARVVK